MDKKPDNKTEIHKQHNTRKDSKRTQSSSRILPEMYGPEEGTSSRESIRNIERIQFILRQIRSIKEERALYLRSNFQSL